MKTIVALSCTLLSLSVVSAQPPAPMGPPPSLYIVRPVDQAGQTPDAPFLRALNADTLVLILPPGQGEMMQRPHAPPLPQPVPPPAPPEKRMPKAP